jgi:ribulose-phosphate 3-epimerase
VPAILTNDVSDFRKKYSELFVLSHYFTKLHIDFADNEFVNNKTIMPADLSFLRNSPLTLMAHFMTYDPKQYFKDCAKAGFKFVFFHFEAFDNERQINETIKAAQDLGLTPGLAINPDTPLYKAAKLIQKMNLIQIMGIRPGFQGLEFMPSTISRIKELRALGKNAIICVDGGIKVGIAKQCAKAGADILIAGSAIVRSQNEETAIEALRSDVET